MSSTHEDAGRRYQEAIEREGEPVHLIVSRNPFVLAETPHGASLIRKAVRDTEERPTVLLNRFTDQLLDELSSRLPDMIIDVAWLHKHGSVQQWDADKDLNKIEAVGTYSDLDADDRATIEAAIEAAYERTVVWSC